MLREVVLAGPRRLRAVVGWSVGHACDLLPTFEQLSGINLEELDEGLTHMGEWFEELYSSDLKDPPS